ncbi:MAG: AraC family transcriptional regulator [Vallitaleaceae bacterium]|nr:AraC family transcriptional regulator [Vallitaleaceae bacterium]
MYNITNLIQDNKLKMAYFEELAKGLYYSTGLGIKVINQDAQELYNYGNSASIIDIFPNALEGFDQYVYKSQAKSINGVNPFTTQYGISYIVAIIANEHQYFGSVLMGPIMLEPVTEQLLNEILISTNLPLTKRSNIKNAYERMSLINHARNYYLCQLLHNILASNVCVTSEMFNPVIENTTVTYEPVEPFLDMQNYDYVLERLFISKVISGDIDNVKILFKDQIKTHYFVNLGTEQLRPIKNNGIMFSTLLSRASIKGGVDPNIALHLADQYISRIEDTFRYSELMVLIEAMVIDFTDHVLQISEVNHVSVVKKVSKYIHAHLSEVIRLNDVADYVDLSPNYFSSLFKREMGIAFADYLNQIRVKESQYLLETTDYSIVDIATATGFNNQNYFTTIFRKHTNTTPKQYRMKVSIK